MQHCNVAVPVDDQPSSLDSQQSDHSQPSLLLVHHLVETCQMLLPATHTSEARRFAAHRRTEMSDHLAYVGGATCTTPKDETSAVNPILHQAKVTRQCVSRPCALNCYLTPLSVAMIVLISTTKHALSAAQH